MPSTKARPTLAVRRRAARSDAANRIALLREAQDNIEIESGENWLEKTVDGLTQEILDDWIDEFCDDPLPEDVEEAEHLIMALVPARRRKIQRAVKQALAL